MKLIEDHAADLLKTHLQSTAATTAGVPDANTLPIIIGPARDDAALPQLAIIVKRVPTEHPRVIELDIEHQLVCDDTAAAIATASAQAQKIRAFLADDAALATFIAALSANDKDGWELNVNHIPGDVRQEMLEVQRHQITISHVWTCLVDDDRR